MRLTATLLKKMVLLTTVIPALALGSVGVATAAPVGTTFSAQPHSKKPPKNNSKQTNQLPKAYFAPPSISPRGGAVVGLAQPVIINFQAPIRDRKTTMKSIRVTTDGDLPGYYYWISDSQLRWKPLGLWPANTSVTVEAGASRSSFQTGQAWIATADDRTKQLVVTLNGKVIRSMPTSMGKDSTPTPNGTYTVGERFASMYMDSSTYGVPIDSPNGYRLLVENAVRISNSGLFVHGAPWSVAQQGNTNASHGCLNLSPADAQWYFNNAPQGSPVVVINTIGGQANPRDGLTDFTVARP